MHKYIISLLAFLVYSSSQAESLVSVMYSTDDKPTKFGKIVFEDTPNGLMITPYLSGLPAGKHGFHFHQHANCKNHGMDAGSHFDPANTDSHQGPLGNGHLGDLPVLEVITDGTTPNTLLAPHLKTSDLKGLAVIIHADGDNYSNQPPLGGGGARIACGIVTPTK